jgi:hypothetical protein
VGSNRVRVPNRPNGACRKCLRESKQKSTHGYGKRYSDKEKEMALELYHQTGSAKRAAAAIGCAASSIYNWLHIGQPGR